MESIRGKGGETRVLSTTRDKIHHFPSSVRISVSGVKLPDTPVPVCRDMYPLARQTCTLSFGDHRTGERIDREDGAEA